MTLRHHPVHESCQGCLAVTDYYCFEDGVICERCYDEETEESKNE